MSVVSESCQNLRLIGVFRQGGPRSPRAFPTFQGRFNSSPSRRWMSRRPLSSAAGRESRFGCRDEFQVLLQLFAALEQLASPVRS